jgi:hypothetical protein
MHRTAQTIHRTTRKIPRTKQTIHRTTQKQTIHRTAQTQTIHRTTQTQTIIEKHNNRILKQRKKIIRPWLLKRLKLQYILYKWTVSLWTIFVLQDRSKCCGSS